MNISNLLDIEGGIRSFFASLAASLTFDLLFAIGIIAQLVVVLFFIIKTSFAYELRTTRILDKLNKWLFVNKKLTTDNIKEFTTLIKKGPKRLSYNWQQYILYREKAPSEYLTVENIIEKPIRASSLKSNIRNMTIISAILSVIIFIAGIAHNNTGDTVLNASMIIVALITPMLMLILLAIAIIGINGKKDANLDELYQNHHLFQRFIDNACVDLPPYIDFTLLFTEKEIERGIPALREFLESRARKEKEEFDRARNEAIVYEKYDFDEAGVDGSNILERAMKETEAYLGKKEKTLSKIAQLEASLESLKKNFDNIQKDFQKKMQVSKENIERLREQQEETTSRIESNYLRKQQVNEIAKQEKEESDFEQQKRRYLVEKSDYEEEIKKLQEELEGGKAEVEKIMLSEYQSFYERICKSALDNINHDIKNEIEELKELREQTEDELAENQTLVKRLKDEVATLRNKLNEKSEIEEPIKEIKKEKATPKVEENFAIEEVSEKSNKPPKVDTKVEEYKIEEVPQYDAPVFEEVKPTAKPVEVETFEFDEPELEYDLPQEEEYSVQDNNQPNVYTEPEEEYAEPELTPETRKRGRPAGSTKQKMLEKTEVRGRGRPRKVEETSEPKKRGRPVGSKTKVNSPSVKKRAAAKASASTGRGRGRPRKNPNVVDINDKIQEEEEKLINVQNDVNTQISQTLQDLDKTTKTENERKRIIDEIEELKIRAVNADDASDEELEEISAKIESLLEQISQLED